MSEIDDIQDKIEELKTLLPFNVGMGFMYPETREDTLRQKGHLPPLF